MASCMECIHFNPCNSHEKIIIEKPTEGNDWGLHNNVEDECKYFTPTADVEEVVRCEKCKHNTDNGGDCDRVLIHTHRNLVTETNEYLCYKLNCCEYGVRK